MEFILVLAWTGGTARAQEGGESITADELADIFGKLKADGFEERWGAIQTVLDLDKNSIPALLKRLGRQHKPSGESMKRVLYALRKQLKDEKIKQLQAKGKTVRIDDIETESPVQFLEILVRERRDDNIIAWRSAAEIMAILVALTSMETTDSILAVIDFSGAYEAAFRKEIYQMIVSTGEKALPAVILRKNEKDENVQTVVTAYLGKMDMTRPAQQVQVKDPAVLIEVLKIFGASRDFEAIDAIAPFLDAENPLIRATARQSILAFGKSALWALRKEYRNYTEQEPDGSWPADKIAQELFKAQDKDRLAPLHSKMEEGLKLAGKRKFDEMERKFQEILAVSPMYERKSEMVPGYLDAARRCLDRGDLEHASFLVRIARRINADKGMEDKITALYYYVEALRSLDDGIADPELMKKAVKLDPGFKEAKSKLGEIENIYRGRKIKGYKIAAAGGIGMTALLILTLILLKRW
jgi:uncharacterized protein YqgV (UPF0045/DUF77 family)